MTDEQREDRCPKCGIGQHRRDNHVTEYACGTYVNAGLMPYQTQACLRRQRDQLQQQVEELTRERDMFSRDVLLPDGKLAQAKQRAEKAERRAKVAEKKADIATRLPFCSDHRDKVAGKECRECEVERLTRERDQAKALEHYTLAESVQANKDQEAAEARAENAEAAAAYWKSCYESAAESHRGLREKTLEILKADHWLDPLTVVRSVQARLEKAEAEAARVRKCSSGHEYLANSHEYPCPWCENAKREAELERVKAENEAMRPVVDQAERFLTPDPVTESKNAAEAIDYLLRDRADRFNPELFGLVEAAEKYRQHRPGEGGGEVRYWYSRANNMVLWWDGQRMRWANGDTWYASRSSFTPEDIGVYVNLSEIDESGARRILGWERPKIKPTSTKWFDDEERGDYYEGLEEGRKQNPQPPQGPFHDSDGREYLLTGEYRRLQKDDYWLHDGEVWGPGNGAGSTSSFWIVRPITQPHCQCRPEREVKAEALRGFGDFAAAESHERTSGKPDGDDKVMAVVWSVVSLEAWEQADRLEKGGTDAE